MKLLDKLPELRVFDVNESEEEQISILLLIEALNDISREMALENADDQARCKLLDRLEATGDETLSMDEFVALLLDAAGAALLEETPLVDRVSFSANSSLHKKTSPFEEVYSVGEMIDEGWFGKVFTCRHRETGEMKAVKVRKKTIWEGDSRQIQAEVETLKQLDHPFCLSVIDVFVEEGHYCIVTDYLEGGSLCDKLDENGALDEESALILVRSQIVESWHSCALWRL